MAKKAAKGSDSGRPLPKRAAKKKRPNEGPPPAEHYVHLEATVPSRPDVGTQAQFKRRKPPATYRYDSSLSPQLEWDEENLGRELAEEQLGVIGRQLSELRQKLAGSKAKDVAGINEQLDKAEEALRKLRALSQPFLNWAGKAERLSFDVPTLPLFVHERLSTSGILKTLKGHRRETGKAQGFLFGDPQRPITDQVLRSYEHRDQWTNRMLLGDSLILMNSLLHYEGLGGQVQMIYMDPPYGVKFGSNFQPFVRRRDVKHGDDADLTREPEMVQAYRDTWEVGLQSYLTYLRDRLLVSRDLLSPSGSIFVQISDENLHHVREVMDEVFGAQNFAGQINFRSMTALGQKGLACVYDYILWYAKDAERIKFRPVFVDKPLEEEPEYSYLDEGKGEFRKLSRDEILRLPDENRRLIFKRSDLTSSGYTPSCTFSFEFDGKTCSPRGGKSWRTTPHGVETLITKHRLFSLGKRVYFGQYHCDFPLMQLENSWHDTAAGFSDPKIYVVQTNNKIVERCLHMTTDPGDLIIDPTCGSGTTAYVAEQWGRRWITMDVSRVPLALARQRLLTATYQWYQLNDEERGPVAGFVYKRRQNNRGEEVGGIVPHVTLKAIANDEPPGEEVLVDRPEVDKKIVRITGAFSFEATIPTPVDLDGSVADNSSSDAATRSVGNEAQTSHGAFTDRMIEVLRRSPVLQLDGNRKITLKNVRPPAKALSLSAEAVVQGFTPGEPISLADAVQESLEEGGKSLPLSSRPVAFVFGPENAAVSEKLVYEAAKEAHAKNYTHLYVIGFSIQPHARSLVDQCEAVVGIPATYVQATPDLLMGDLLKNMRSSQVFSVCGLPDVELVKAGTGKFQVELLGLDVFDPISMEPSHRSGNDVPAWFLDTDYNDLCFHVCQAFFPRTSAWDNLKKALKGDYEETVWDHLSGTTSAPFEPGDYQQIAVKVIDDRGNELLVVRKLSEAKK